MAPDFIIATRLMWPGGVFRTALEEARYTSSKLYVLRKAHHPTPFSTEGVNFEILRNSNSNGNILTNVFSLLTLFYDKERGTDATIDLDLIFKLSKMGDIKDHNILYFDQFIALSGYINYVKYGKSYNIFLHETVLGRKHDLKTVPLAMYDKLILRHAKNVITNSLWNQKVLANFGIKSQVVYLGCDPVDKLNFKRKPIVIAVSMWDRFRKPELYVDLAKEVNAEVWICGSWTRDDYKMEFIEKYGDAVHVTGPITDDFLNDLYNEASFYIRFGFEERGPGLGGIEALGHGLPVISNQGLGISEVIDDSVNGFIVSDMHEAAEKINHVLSNNEKHLVMIKNAWLKGRELSWANHAKRVTEILRGE